MPDLQYGMRPVLWAALYGHLDVLRYLVNTGATATCTNRVSTSIMVQFLFIVHTYTVKHGYSGFQGT